MAGAFLAQVSPMASNLQQFYATTSEDLLVHRHLPQMVALTTFFMALLNPILFLKLTFRFGNHVS